MSQKNGLTWRVWHCYAQYESHDYSIPLGAIIQPRLLHGSISDLVIEQSLFFALLLHAQVR